MVSSWTLARLYVWLGYNPEVFGLLFAGEVCSNRVFRGLAYTSIVGWTTHLLGSNKIQMN